MSVFELLAESDSAACHFRTVEGAGGKAHCSAWAVRFFWTGVASPEKTKAGPVAERELEMSRYSEERKTAVLGKFCLRQT